LALAKIIVSAKANNIVYHILGSLKTTANKGYCTKKVCKENIL